MLLKLTRPRLRSPRRTARLTGAGLTTAALVATAVTLLWRRGEIAAELGATGSLVPEFAAIGALAAAGAAVLAVDHTRVLKHGRRSAKATSFIERAFTGVGAMCAGGSLWLSAKAVIPGAWTVCLIAAAVGFSPTLAFARPLLSEEMEVSTSLERKNWHDRDLHGHRAQYTAFSYHLAAATLGVLGALAPLLFTSVSAESVLIGSAIASLCGGLLCLLGLEGKLPEPEKDGLSSIGLPWPLRACGAAFALGSLLVGASDSARGLLIGEWQQTPRGTFATVFVTVAAGTAAILFSRRYRRLAERSRSARARGIGLGLFVGGSAASLGSLSFNYWGLLALWVIAAASLAITAVGIEAATWTSLRGSARRLLSALETVSFGAGVVTASVILAIPFEGRHDQLKIVLAALPCMAVGLLTARGSARAQAANSPQATRIRRRRARVLREDVDPKRTN